MTFMTLLLVLSLLGYRTARMITQEDGPWDVFTRLRQWVGQKTWIGRGVHCVACMSVYTVGLAVLYLTGFRVITWADAPLLWLAAAGGALAIYQVVR